MSPTRTARRWCLRPSKFHRAVSLTRWYVVELVEGSLKRPVLQQRRTSRSLTRRARRAVTHRRTCGIRDVGPFHWAPLRRLLLWPRSVPSLCGWPSDLGLFPRPWPWQLDTPLDDDGEKIELVACVTISKNRPMEEIDDQGHKLALRSAELGMSRKVSGIV